jgi:MFS transporter, SP family, arabinose:H+ symporter
LIAGGRMPPLRRRLNRYLLKSTVVGALGGLLFGFDTAVISGAIATLVPTFSLTTRQLGITVASALVGAVVGAMFSGYPGERWGRRDGLRLMACLYLVSAVGCAFAWSWQTLLFFRFIGGLGIGGSSVLGPMYIAELAPARLRGRLVAVFQINIVIGALLAYFSNYVLGTFHLGLNEWRWQLGISAVPALGFLSMLFGIPRSSRWLVSKSRVEEARQVLKLTGAPNFEAELREIIESVHLDRSAEPFFQRKYLFPIFLAILTGAFNQLSGVNVILYYLNDIFSRAGFSRVSGDLQAVAVGVTNLIFTPIGMALVDKVGRKALLLFGCAGLALCMGGISYIFWTRSDQAALVWFLMAYVALFALSQGVVVWVYIGEIFPTRVRAKGQSLGSSSHWIFNVVISGIFPILAGSSGAYPFIFFGAMMVLQFFLVLFIYPETKNTSLEQIQHHLKMD